MVINWFIQSHLNVTFFPLNSIVFLVLKKNNAIKHPQHQLLKFTQQVFKTVLTPSVFNMVYGFTLVII